MAETWTCSSQFSSREFDSRTNTFDSEVLYVGNKQEMESR